METAARTKPFGGLSCDVMPDHEHIDRNLLSPEHEKVTTDRIDIIHQIEEKHGWGGPDGKHD